MVERCYACDKRLLGESSFVFYWREMRGNNAILSREHTLFTTNAFVEMLYSNALSKEKVLS